MTEHVEADARGASRGARRFRRLLGRSWQALVVLALAVALGVLAFLSPGLVQADVHLDEGTVYAGNRAAGLIGTVNAQIDELAGATSVGDTEFRILQDKDLVMVHGTKSSTLVRYNPALNRLESPLQLPAGALVELSGGTLMVANSDNGKVYHGSPDDILKLDFQGKADFEVGNFGTATVTASGGVIGLNAQESVLVRQGPDGIEEVPLPFKLDASVVNVSLSAVGDKAVVLDRQSGRIWLEGMPKAFEVSGAATAELAAPMPDALGGDNGAKALYATQAGLVALTADGPRSLSGNLDASPIQPVQVGACVYAVFGNQFVKKCRGADVLVRDIPELGEGADLAFLVNRGTVALNDVASGTIWMVDKDMLVIKDWERLVPPSEETPETVEEGETVIPQDRDRKNRAPVAKDDNLAARAGRSTILPILDNDSDPDGDVLTVTSRSNPKGASLQAVRGGSGLQVTVDAETTGTISFDYTIDDGRGGKDTATVTLRILPADPKQANDAPFKSPLAQPLKIQLGQTTTKRLLLDWRDPDGDSLILVDAWLPKEAEDEVSFTPDGQVTFVDIGKTTGTKTVHVKVSDGYIVSDGELVVRVVDEVVDPIAFGDFATTATGKVVTVHPLDNDIGANLNLTEVNAPCGRCAKPNYREGWFTFAVDEPGVYYVTYKVSNGPVAFGLVRIDVRAETTNHAPVAALDVALLPPGGSVLVDPVLNDTDEDGDVLVVQTITPKPGIDVVLERRHLVTITAKHTPDAPVTLQYRLSDGKHSVLGTIVLIPTPTTGSATPLAERDEVKVRAGSTQAVDVLANDTSPIGLRLTLDELVENPFGDAAWIDGNFIRVAAPEGAQATTANITYQIKDSDGRIASSQLRVSIVSEDAQNEAPTPRQVVERVLSGTSTRLSVPLEGIDGNGDAVRLVGLASGPKLGRVLAVGDGWLTYEAFPGSQGTDVFGYEVVDAFGEKGVGEIRVGVAPPGPDNSPPTAVPDEVRVRPGRQVQLAALRNDVDIDGDAIAFQAADPVRIDGVTKAEIVDKREISFVAPEKEGEYQGTYSIEDSRGASADGYLTVVVDAAAPLMPPETRDDLVSVSAVIGKDWVEIDPLANDYDPDGPREALTVALPASGQQEDSAPRLSKDRTRVTVPVRERMQQVRYSAVDADGLTSTGLILVPGRNDSVPVLKDAGLVLNAVAGQPLSIDINSVVAGTQGRVVKLASVETVAPTHGSVSPGAERIEYTADIDYSGPASVVFQVRDVVAEGDKSGRSAFVSIPIKVAPSPVSQGSKTKDDIEVAKSAPELIGGQPRLAVGPDEGEFKLELTPLFKDPDGDTFFFENFRAGESTGHVEWKNSQDGSRIFASAPIDAKPGTYQIVHATVRDAAGAKTDFTIRIEVTTSNRPVPVAGTDTVDEAIAGQEVVVPVLLNDKSNLKQPGLKLIPDGARIIAGSGSIRTDGDVVRIKPDEGFVGTLTATYAIVDATNDPNRRVDGTIRVTVKSKPSRPGAPRDGQAGNGTVTFTYTPGGSNGLDILTRQAVAMNAAGKEVAVEACKSTTCTFTGLPNGQPYTFKVMETNKAGASEWSPTSAAWTPDVKPNAPAAPVAKFGDGELTVTWAAPSWADPSNPGSPVDQYQLFLFDQGGAQVGRAQQVPASSTTFTWKQLTNGTRYKFKVLAHNRAGDSPLSEFSNVEWPAGRPGAVSDITATRSSNPLGGAFTLKFPADAAPNGDPITHYIITPMVQGGGNVPDKAVRIDASGAAELQATIEGLGQKGYRFNVVGFNKAGAGEARATPSYQVAWQLPETLKFEAQPGDGGVTLTMQTNYDSRSDTDVVREYQVDDGGWRPWPTKGLVTDLVNGRNYSFAGRVTIAGGTLSSSPAGAKGMPRSARPGFPRLDETSFRWVAYSGGRYTIEFRAKPPVDLEDTGGWPLSGFLTRCEGASGSKCSPDSLKPGWQYSYNSRLNGDGPETIAVTMNHSKLQTQQNTTVVRPFAAEWKNGSLKVTLRYVEDASCKFTLPGDIPVQQKDQDSPNTFNWTWQYTPPEGGIVPATGQLECTANGMTLKENL